MEIPEIESQGLPRAIRRYTLHSVNITDPHHNIELIAVLHFDFEVALVIICHVDRLVE